MKSPFTKLLLLLLILPMAGCSTWFFPHYVETRGTWTGTIDRESLSRSEPTPFTAFALVLTVESGPSINIHRMGLLSHTETRAAQGSQFILVDSADRTILAPELIGKKVAVKGTIYPWKWALDSNTDEGIGNQFWVLETSRKQLKILVDPNPVAHAPFATTNAPTAAIGTADGPRPQQPRTRAVRTRLEPRRKNVSPAGRDSSPAVPIVAAAGRDVPRSV